MKTDRANENDSAILNCGGSLQASPVSSEHLGLKAIQGNHFPLPWVEILDSSPNGSTLLCTTRRDGTDPSSPKLLESWSGTTSGSWPYLHSPVLGYPLWFSSTVTISFHYMSPPIALFFVMDTGRNSSLRVTEQQENFFFLCHILWSITTLKH